jgi:predicted alpha/beta superfamily hydrolase
MNWLLLGGAMGMMVAAKARGESRQITFEVTTKRPLPVGEQVFVTGNHDSLGNWDPDGFPLTRTDDNVWSGSAAFPAGQAIEYKITRGSWDSEEALADGSVPAANKTVLADQDREVQHEVARWKDAGATPIPQITGNYRIHESVHSNFLRFDRRVIVWLPPSYAKDRKRRYPVLYMHDGQQVFDPQTSTWKQDWEIDEWCAKLIAQKQLKDIIVVAAYSTEDRFVEYNPSLGGPQYARFMIEELKPFIDKEYRTLPGRESTAVAGASMGGTISFFLAWTRPDIYFGTACLSPAFRFKNDQFCMDLVRGTPRPPDSQLYFYCGLGDSTEQELAEGMNEMVGLLETCGFKRGGKLRVTEDMSARHNEAAWAKHSKEWLLYLFGK